LALTGDTAFKICFNINSESPISSQVLKILDDDNDDFVEISQKMTHHLFSIQKGNNASGIVLIIKGTLDKKNICVLLKLEKDEGAQLNLDPKTESYNIVEVKDLMLTKKTKIFKIALLLNRDAFNFDYDGQIMDFQTNIKQKKEISTYFINDFLGCIPYQDPKVTTQKFYNYTVAFINSSISDQIRQAKYHQDLNSYLQMNKNQLSPKEFADNYFEDTNEKDDFKRYLESKNFYFETFSKDVTLISNKITKIMVSFQNGISIIGNKGSFDDKVKITDEGQGIHKAEIISKISKIQ
jgi:hypothetical protein